MNRTPRSWLPLILTLVVIVLDRATKQIVDSTMTLGQSIPFIGDTIQWTLVYNYGMAFGMKLTGGSVLGYMSVVAVIVILFVLLRTPPKSGATRWILAAILGGAVGNTYDRIAYGYVVDFIDVDLPDFMMGRWPVFNIADSAVSVGVVLMVLMMIFVKDQHEDETVSEVDIDEMSAIVDGHGEHVSMTPVDDEVVSGQNENDDKAESHPDNHREQQT